ncbi:MAG: GNAT family N-acetyltransferase [Bacteroidetes bacterium]|nr:GNAT family N-acetyltransferase [Bacteroidota bacterium]
MKIIEVNDKKTIKEFLDTARIIYKGDEFWVCPLDQEIESIFDSKKNVFFAHGEAIRWILKNDKGELIGRVAAFINRNKANNFEQPTGGMGFFECVNDKNAAKLLFDTCKNWLQDKGMEAMDGPINFGENDRFWGLLVEGFMHPGYGMQYHHPYYKELFESYGFKFYFEQVSNHLNLTKPFPERFWKIAEWVSNKKEFQFEHFLFKNAEKYIDDLKHVYDTAWAYHENFTPIEKSDLRNTLNNAKSIIEEEFIWFAYHEGEPIAFLVMFPDINQALKHLNGNMNFFNKLKFASLLKKKTITRSRIVIMGVVPKFQKSGIESAIFWNLDKVMKRKPHYTEIELSWVGDFNPKMRALHESVGAIFGKRHITYRKLFKDEVEYKRSTIIPVDTKEKALGLK